MDNDSGVVYYLDLIEKRSKDGSNEEQQQEIVKMGVVRLTTSDEITLTDFRNEIRNQFPSQELKRQFAIIMDNYAFVTVDNYPINTIQENEFSVNDKQVLRENNTIAIQRRTENVEIRVLTKDGTEISSLNATSTTLLTEIRKDLLTALKENAKYNGLEFNFVDLNGSLIPNNNEAVTNVFEVYDNQSKSIKISFQENRLQQKKSRKFRRSFRWLKFRPNKKNVPNGRTEVSEVESATLVRTESEKKYQLMISYATQDAADYARKLCDELEILGLSVYLDKHEIKYGDDWPQSLNSAVVNCRVFIPIVTAKYGNTFWTKRELETAVGLQNKLIIPIQQVEPYPPVNLTIFLWPTQAVCGKQNVKTVAKEIYERSQCFLSAHIECDPIIEPTIAVVGHPRHSDTYEKLRKVLESNFGIKCNAIWAQNESNALFNELNRKLKKRISQKSENTDLINKENKEEKVNGIPDETPAVDENTVDKPLNTSDGSDKLNCDENSGDLASKQDANESTMEITENHTADETVKPEPDSSPEKEGPTKQTPANDTHATDETITASSPKSERSMEDNDDDDDSNESDRKNNKEKKNMLRDKRKLDAAKGIILLISNESFECQKFLQYTHYSALKSKTIVVVCEDTEYPEWFLRSFPVGKYLDANDEQFAESLSEKVSQEFNSDSETGKTDAEILRDLVQPIVKNIPEKQTCVYIHDNGDENEIYKSATLSIVSELGKLNNVTLMVNETNAYKETISKTFLESKTANNKSSQSNVLTIETNTNSDENNEITANSEAAPNIVPNIASQTILVGENDYERDEAIAAACDVCILFPDNEYIAKQVNRFEYHEKYVIPLILDTSNTFEVLNYTFDMLNTAFGVEKGELVIDGENVNNATKATIKIIKEVINLRFPEVNQIKESKTKKSDEKCLIL